MIPLHQALTFMVHLLVRWAGALTQHISWSNYHCLDEDAVIWADTFRLPAQPQPSS
ncbi:hypothetical protein FB556_2087 [Enteractinococcus coprophilus]|uniref:Uncharacterized protein n=1 Tax=Enteractinococcus coprophilus TaxID=1027633 RepID=A0A543AG97_9MICC|nr:hypothetical protein FB556_2087 [Enteractinococcus coprophilus]